MKLISLNIWGGQKHKELLEFIKEINGETDIICLQEVFKSENNIFSRGSKMNIYSDLENILNDYQIFFAPTFTNYDLLTKVDFDTAFGEVTYVKKSIKVVSEGTVFTYRNFDEKKLLYHDDFGEYWDLPRNFHYVIIRENGKEFLIANLHGFWKPGAKIDTKESLEQSNKILEFIKSFNGSKIICGDFNLAPNTRSINKLEEELVNLITEYSIYNTRSKFYTRNEKFADYIFVSPDVKVKKFEVLDKHVSDHLPLFIDFE